MRRFWRIPLVSGGIALLAAAGGLSAPATGWAVGSGSPVAVGAPSRDPEPVAPAGDLDLANLEPDQRIADFVAEAVYENEAGRTIGARFRQAQSGFVLDVLRIQSVPQTFFWVNTLPVSDRGEPHTLEHLLLGKGTKGRYVASLEDVSLGQSSAFTDQRRTCYDFNTAAGSDVFFALFEAKLDALLHPNYSDEEIRREVCNVGVVEDENGESARLEEKGTVYNEMVSSYEQPWGDLYLQLARALYGEGHPLSLDSGGLPSGIRELRPEDVRRFHDALYHLNNMGAVVSIGDEVSLGNLLQRLSEILRRVEPDATKGDDPAGLADRLPAPDPAPAGGIYETHFPNQNPSEPGLLVFAWPARLDPDARGRLVLEILMNLMASGETSNLYRTFIDSQTREMDLGATSVFNWVSSEPGHAIFLGFGGVDPGACGRESIEKVRARILDEFRAVADLKDGSPELAAFNERARNLLLAKRRSLRKFLNSPPRFGYRDTGSQWIEHLQQLRAEQPGFRRDLSLREDLAGVDSLLSGGANFWKGYLETWGLIDHPPYACATTADPEQIAEDEHVRQERLRDFTAGLRERFGVDSDERAIAAYREEYDENTRVLEEEGKKIPMPSFVSDPPLTLDDRLRYSVGELPGGGQLVASTFDTMTGGTVGIALRLDVVPESLLVYVAALPTILKDIGVIRDGEPLAYNEFREALRGEILGLDAYYSTNFRTERVELTIRASGSDLPETEKAIDWMDVVLFHPDLRSENLPRIRDAVDVALRRARDRMSRAEETWVQEPANAYWKQDDPLLLNAACFLTQAHALHRLRWLLRSAGEDGGEVAGFLAEAPVHFENDRQAMSDAFSAILDTTATTAGASGDEQPLLALYRSLSPPSQGIAREAVRDLRQSLSDIPEDTLAEDLSYLCGEMAADLEVPPRAALQDIERLLELLRHQQVARAFVISSTEDGEIVRPAVQKLILRLSGEPVEKQVLDRTPRVLARLDGRIGDSATPVFVGLVDENTRSGVHIHTADCASYEDTGDEKLLRFLSARLYGGGGAHSIFMKTWGAGLAYSNGIRSNENTGRLIYYAERCPDLAQTMQFVIGQLENAPEDPSLADYAVAQAFTGDRSGAGYEERGEAMAADLADGLTPDVVTRFRREILELRGRNDLYRQLRQRLASTCGQVLPGYGPSGAEAARETHAIYYAIGPEKQLKSWETYLQKVEPGARLYRLYPRDYWQTRTEGERIP